MANDVSSHRIFAPTSMIIDDSQLCFNKNHFARPDFDVQRFMNLVRRRASLEQIQKDLRLYLKSIQHSMIELINDDYADFVHLSSNLVSLQTSIDKIERDLQNIWEEFESSTAESVGTAENVEIRCEQLATNRRAQAELRDRIAFISSLQRLSILLSEPSDSLTMLTMLWIERIASCVVDLTSYDAVALGSPQQEKDAYTTVISKLEKVLSAEGVASVTGDCSTFPLILSVLSLTKSTHSLTASIIADLLHPRLVTNNLSNHALFSSVIDGVKQMRSNWANVLGVRYSGQVELFLDQTLLTFIGTFVDKCLGTIAVPSDTKMFHKCYLLIQEFIQSWPTAKMHRQLLKSIRDKFNLVVYFKLKTHKDARQVDTEIDPKLFELIADPDEDSVVCRVSATILKAVETLWSESSYLPSIIDKSWDFTLRMLGKHLAWTRAMIQSVIKDKVVPNNMAAWECLLKVRLDAKLLHEKVFDLALEQIWTKLSDLNIDTSQFGQCLTRFGAMVDAECVIIEKAIGDMVVEQINLELNAITDIPKQYRWTKKPLPTTHSGYLDNAERTLANFSTEIQSVNEDTITNLIEGVRLRTLNSIVVKAEELLNQVEATGSSLSRFKRKGASSEGTTDDDKIKAQIYYDLNWCSEMANSSNIALDKLQELIDRSRPDLNTAVTNGSSHSSIGKLDDISSVSPEPDVNRNTFEANGVIVDTDC